MKIFIIQYWVLSTAIPHLTKILFSDKQWAWFDIQLYEELDHLNHMQNLITESVQQIRDWRNMIGKENVFMAYDISECDTGLIL
jgi:hypothetical protein